MTQQEKKQIIRIEGLTLKGDALTLAVRGEFALDQRAQKVKLVLHFFQGDLDRRLPMVFSQSHWDEAESTLVLTGEYTYLLNQLFGKWQSWEEEISLSFNLLLGDAYTEQVPVELSTTRLVQDGKSYTLSLHGRPNRQGEAGASDVAQSELEAGEMPDGGDDCLCRLGFCPKFSGGPGKESRLSRYATLAGKVVDGLKSGQLRSASDFTLRLQRKKNRGYIHQVFAETRARQGVVPNQVAFLSVRREELSGNFHFVYQALRHYPELKLCCYFNTKELAEWSEGEMAEFARLCATSKVILLDEYTAPIYTLPLARETRLIQLWHACGAFKTFGYTRLGKPGGTEQNSLNHRTYDYAIVSGRQVADCYAEGFGIPTSHVVATGIPRTDIFFDSVYREEIRGRLYAKYPQLKGKRVILFAPTFRGHVREDGDYPMERFVVEQFMQAVGEEFFLVIKHHPFVRRPHPLPEAMADRVLDLSGESEINDLLFVTDLVITDYSSLVFEASLLKLPMLFYTFDLEQYILERDFYYDFSTFVPGKIVYTQNELEEAVVSWDVEQHKVEAFAHRFFDDLDGKSAQRVGELILQSL